MSARLVGTLHFDMQASLNVYIGFWKQFTLKMTSEHEFFPGGMLPNPLVLCMCLSCFHTQAWWRSSHFHIKTLTWPNHSNTDCFASVYYKPFRQYSFVWEITIRWDTWHLSLSKPNYDLEQLCYLAEEFWRPLVQITKTSFCYENVHRLLLKVHNGSVNAW